MLRTFAVEGDIIDAAPIMIAENAVADPALGQSCDRTSQQSLHALHRIGAREMNLTHVGDVEKSGGFPHSRVLGLNGRVLNRHGEARKIHHARAEFDVARMQWGALDGAHRPFRLR